MLNDTESLERFLNLAQAEIEPKVNTEGHTEFMLVPSGTRVESLAVFFPPKRVVQTVSLLDAQSFIDYVNRYKNKSTTVFCTATDSSMKLRAIIDYHEGAQPGECKHVAFYDMTATAEWQLWLANNKKQMTQRQFAEFLEENQRIFVDPSGAHLMELALNLEGKSDVRFKSSMKLQSGANRLDYTEDVELRGAVNSQSGSVEVPTVIKVGFVLFHGVGRNEKGVDVPYEVQARLKFKIENGKLSLWYETINPHVIVRDIIKMVVKEVSEKTGIIPLLGSAQ